jgi:hypothetical protein
VGSCEHINGPSDFKRCGEFLTEEILSFSRRTMLHGVGRLKSNFLSFIYQLAWLDWQIKVWNAYILKHVNLWYKQRIGFHTFVKRKKKVWKEPNTPAKLINISSTDTRFTFVLSYTRDSEVTGSVLDECSSIPHKKRAILCANVSKPALVPIRHTKFVIRTHLLRIKRLKHEAQWKFTSTVWYLKVEKTLPQSYQFICEFIPTCFTQ